MRYIDQLDALTFDVTGFPARYKIEAWEELLSGHPDTTVPVWTCNGLRNGFKIGRDDTVPSPVYRNLPCNDDQWLAVSQWVISHHGEGKLAGPYDSAPSSDYFWSPIGAVPKKVDHNTGDVLKWRIIHHLSKGKISVNSGIPDEYARCTYLSVRQLVKFIYLLGPGAWVWKYDLKNAYRQFPIHPSDVHYLGIKWEGKFYFDKALPMGLKSACGLFTRLGDAMQYCTWKRSPESFYVSNDVVLALIHYIDDFAGGAQCMQYDKAVNQFIVFKETMGILGVDLSLVKFLWPAQLIELLGIYFNTKQRTLALPEHKILDVERKINTIMPKRRASYKELKSLQGSLQWCCNPIWVGSAFMQNLNNELRGLNPRHYGEVNKELKADLDWWKFALRNLNALPMKYFLMSELRFDTEFQLYTDACPRGIGAFIEGTGMYFQLAIPAKWYEVFHINVLELMVPVIALIVWGEYFHHKTVSIWIDNMTAQFQLIKKHASNKCEQRMLAIICATAVKYQCYFWTERIDTKLNTVADALSRNWSLAKIKSNFGTTLVKRVNVENVFELLCVTKSFKELCNGLKFCVL